MQSSNIKRLKQQEADNRKLIQMYAELSLTFQLQQNIIKKLQYQRQFVKVQQNLISRYCVTIRISCTIVNLSCCAYYNQLNLVDDFMMNSLFKSITDKHLRWRFPKFFYRIMINVNSQLIIIRSSLWHSSGIKIIPLDDYLLITLLYCLVKDSS